MRDQVYKSKEISGLLEFYDDLLFSRKYYPVIRDHLGVIAQRMFEGFKARHEELYVEFSNYHPNYIGNKKHEFNLLDITLEDCQLTTAREYGFRNWEEITDLKDHYDLKFEKAIDHLLAGETRELGKLIKMRPELVNARSKYGHRATLLHYAASNGVELYRQIVPKNLPDCISLLLENGADKEATMKVLGGEFSTLHLLVTSEHPFKAGVADKCIKLLE